MEKKYLNSFSGRMLLTVMLGMLLISLIVSVTVIRMSQNAFQKTYAASQEKVFEEIELNLEQLHDTLTDITDAIDESWAFRLYLTQEELLGNEQEFRNIYQMERDLNNAKGADMDRLNVLVVGLNGKHYLSRTEVVSMSDADILKSEQVQRALENPEVLHYMYSHGAFTATAKDSDVLLAIKALCYAESRECYAVVIFTLPADYMQNYYDYFVSDHTAFYLTDKAGTVICASDRAMLGKTVEAVWYQGGGEAQSAMLRSRGSNITVLHRTLPYMGLDGYGIIDNYQALRRLYNVPLLILICVLTGALILLLTLYFTGRTVRPLQKLSDRMANVKEGNFDEYMTVEGTNEVRELSSTYNYMLDNTRRYVDELMETQREMRSAEIKALQMQINPHYIYNTLASIKWLVYQNDTRKTVDTIDAFISLLRNTISNADEFITMDQETENLKNYVRINRTRYGDRIAVFFYISEESKDCLLPKMILQPFVENAFFHAFPDNRSGKIEICTAVLEDKLEIRIADDGIGMDEKKARDVVNHDTGREHFTGIGVHNVQDRLVLLYGRDYGIRLQSNTECGTVVIVTLPAIRWRAENE